MGFGELNFNPSRAVFMKTPRLRITIQLMMLMVAVLASAFAWVRNRAARLDTIADQHERLLEEIGSKINRFRETHPVPDRQSILYVQRLVRLEGHHETLVYKYRWAARHPLQPIEPDPPCPK